MLQGHEVICIDNFFTGNKSNVSQWIGHPNFELIRCACVHFPRGTPRILLTHNLTIKLDTTSSTRSCWK
jgi:hypothetical protein